MLTSMLCKFHGGKRNTQACSSVVHLELVMWRRPRAFCAPLQDATGWSSLYIGVLLDLLFGASDLDAWFKNLGR